MDSQVEARFNELEKRLATLEDIEAIKKVGRAYGYYLEHLMYNEVADLWTDDGIMEWTGLGRFIGKETIRNQWKTTKARFMEHGNYMHLAPQISPYITISPDGKKAWGRWYTNSGAFLYENDYVKENGVWKMKIMRVGGLPRGGSGSPSAPGGAGGPGLEINEGEAEAERANQEYMSYYNFSERISRVPRQEFPTWIRPFHFKHPVTGKKTTEDEWNKANPVPMPPGGEKWTAKKAK